MDKENRNITQEEIEKAIEEKLQEQNNKVVNRNAIKALFAAFGPRSNALGQIFLGRRDALNEKRHKIEQTEILNLLCKIDNALTETIEKLKPVSPFVLDGIIEVRAKDTVNATGVSINSPTIMKPGTRISTSAEGVENFTGLRIEMKG